MYVIERYEDGSWQTYCTFKVLSEAQDSLIHLTKSFPEMKLKLIDMQEIIKKCCEEIEVESPAIVRGGLYCKWYDAGWCYEKDKINACVGYENCEYWLEANKGAR